ncbi:type ISP restriction/modification enzyme, partial [Ralstonia pseudosolanacearum]|uniref:type ISP restriction/modification enzyme n=1 Tax=Ralstonia pseudosolanacearum TaxID=1310165 RepID=UPI003CF420AD
EEARQGTLYGFGDDLERRDGISDWILNEARKRYGANVSKEDIFYYVYGFLHLPSYRERFANELKKSLPRITLSDKFWELSRAGRELADIKLRLSKDKTILTYNDHITIKNIPPRSFDYVVNGRSPLEWIIDRYQVKTDSASGIINDPNDWSLEHDNPRYIFDLILSSITV